jgi:hypothetical protein
MTNREWVKGLQPGIAVDEALAAFERHCKQPPKTLWITESWWTPRRATLRIVLSDPITEDECRALHEALFKTTPVDNVIEWLQTWPAMSWEVYRGEKLRIEIEPRRQQYYEVEQGLWSPADEHAPEHPDKDKEHVHWFCLAATPTRRDEILRMSKAEQGTGCPECNTPVESLETRFVELFSPYDGAMEGRGWLVVCHACHLVVQSIFPRAEQRWAFYQLMTGQGDAA